MTRAARWKRIAKPAFLVMANVCGNAILQSFQLGRVLVVCYHSVVPDDTPDPYRFGNIVTCSEFAAHLRVLASEFDVISVGDLKAWMEDDGLLPARPVLVTFDDGYRNNLSFAAPLLLQFRVPALFFVTTGYISTQRLLWPLEVQERILSWNRSKLPLPSGGEREVPVDRAERYKLAEAVREECKGLSFNEGCAYLDHISENMDARVEAPHWLTFMTWDDVRELAGLGFDIGSHTVEHPILSRVSDHQLWSQLRDSKQRLEQELSRACVYFAYPNGRSVDISSRADEFLRKAGYTLGFTTIPRFCSRRDNPMRLGRVVIPDHASVEVFRFHVSMLHSTARRLFQMGG